MPYAERTIYILVFIVHKINNSTSFQLIICCDIPIYSKCRRTDINMIIMNHGFWSFDSFVIKLMTFITMVAVIVMRHNINIHDFIYSYVCIRCLNKMEYDLLSSVLTRSYCKMFGIILNSLILAGIFITYPEPPTVSWTGPRPNLKSHNTE